LKEFIMVKPKITVHWKYDDQLNPNLLRLIEILLRPKGKGDSNKNTGIGTGKENGEEN